MDSALSGAGEMTQTLGHLELSDFQDARDRQLAIRAIRQHVWRSLTEGLELTWFSDPTAGTATRLLDRTIARLRERRAHEDEWRRLLADR